MDEIRANYVSYQKNETATLYVQKFSSKAATLKDGTYEIRDVCLTATSKYLSLYGEYCLEGTGKYSTRKYYKIPIASDCVWDAADGAEDGVVHSTISSEQFTQYFSEVLPATQAGNHLGCKITVKNGQIVAVNITN